MDDGVLNGAGEVGALQIDVHLPIRVLMEDGALQIGFLQVDMDAVDPRPACLGGIGVGIDDGMDQDAVIRQDLAALDVHDGVLGADGDGVLSGVHHAVPDRQSPHLRGHAHDTVDVGEIASADGGAVVEGHVALTGHDPRLIGHVKITAVEEVVAHAVGIGPVAGEDGLDLAVVGLQLHIPLRAVGRQGRPAVADDRGIIEVGLGVGLGAVGAAVALDLQRLRGMAGILQILRSRAVGMDIGVVDIQLGILLRCGAAAGFSHGEDLAVPHGHLRVVPGEQTGALAAQTVRVGMEEYGGILHSIAASLAGDGDAAGIRVVRFDIDVPGLALSDGPGNHGRLLERSHLHLSLLDQGNRGLRGIHTPRRATRSAGSAGTAGAAGTAGRRAHHRHHFLQCGHFERLPPGRLIGDSFDLGHKERLLSVGIHPFPGHIHYTIF